MSDKNKIDVYLSRVSHFSQFVLVAFAIFGYFYTVKPVYQKERLSEDIARKEVELDSLHRVLNESNKKLSLNTEREESLKANVYELQEEVLKSKNELENIHKEMEVSKSELVKQRKLASEAISINRGNLKEVYFENFSGIVLQFYIKKSYGDPANRIKDHRFTSVDDLRRTIVTPYDSIVYAIENNDGDTMISARNVPSNLRKDIVLFISKRISKDSIRLKLSPSDIETVFAYYDREKTKIKDLKGVDAIVANHKIDSYIHSYISQMNVKNMRYSVDYIDGIRKNFK